MQEDNIIKMTQKYVQETLQNDSSGHDWWHVYRVWKIAKYIAQKEGANLFIIELAALLHDIADWKFHDGDTTVGPKAAQQWLEQLSVSSNIIKDVCSIIHRISFKGAKTKQDSLTLEGKIVQDADRLDAIGAIGIGRTFAYGGYKGRPMYDPKIKPEPHESFEAYKNSKGTTINHFYEKLFLIKDRLNTKTGRQIAEQRHAIMENFVKEFLLEWNSEFEWP